MTIKEPDPYPVRVADLKRACGRFEAFGRPDRSYAVFTAATDGKPNLTRLSHRVALHKWLNAWGCRIRYSRDGEADLFDQSLSEWWETWARRLPSVNVRVAELTNGQVARLAEAYGDLWSRPAAPGRRPGSVRTLAPTATAKTLWALRPKAVTAWDARIARRLHGGRDQAAFSDHLLLARSTARSLLREAGSEAMLLRAVGRPNATVAKLLDEYWYITISIG